MHSRRLASLLIGAWLAASILMDFVVIQNFRAVDRFLNAPGPVAAEQMRALGGKGEARVFLRHETGELNRFLFEQWEYAQFVIGAALVLGLLFGHGDVPKIALGLAVAMLAMVAVQRFYLTPEVTRLGRLLDFPETPGADAALFWRLHGVYSGVELLKIALGLGVAGTMLTRHVDRKQFVREHEKLARQPAATGLS